MLAPCRIIGSFLSPYVRKVLVCLEVKKIAYEVDQLTPFFGTDEFSRLSPLRRIPVLIDDQVTLCDSTVIAEYLEERYPDPPLLPRTAALRARCRWLEEYADTRMGDVCIWQFFYQLQVRRLAFGEDPDQELVAQAREQGIPSVLDYLERELPPQGLLFGSLSIADIAIASMLRNATIAGYRIDAQKWPRTDAYCRLVQAQPEFVKLRRYEDVIVDGPPGERRARLQAIGAPLTATTVSGKQRHASIMLRQDQ